MLDNSTARFLTCLRIICLLHSSNADPKICTDLDDKGLYKCHGLLDKGPWRLREVRNTFQDPIPFNASWGPGAPPPQGSPPASRWVWEYDGPDDIAPADRVMIEEPLGPYERKLLLLNKGRENFIRLRNRQKKLLEELS